MLVKALTAELLRSCGILVVVIALDKSQATSTSHVVATIKPLGNTGDSELAT